MIVHEKYMYRCLELAEKGIRAVMPNPMVGAVLVYNDRIIGEGFHEYFGGPHAEVNCLASVKDSDKHLISDSMLYVSLEPCNHFGKTPPCSNLIIEKGIKSVVVGCIDPFEAVNGSGIQRLKQTGVNVISGVIESQAKKLNRRFFTFHQQKRPYIILKWAQSANEMIAGKGAQPVNISNELTNRLVHKWRSEEAAILVGTTTALTDNPHLTVRHWSGKNPYRVLVDRWLKVPETANLYDGAANTIVVNSLKSAQKNNVLFYRCGKDDNVLAAVSNLLYQRQLQSVMVEGGAKTLQSFINSGLWDEARVITNTALCIDQGVSSPSLTGFSTYKRFDILDDRIELFFK